MTMTPLQAVQELVADAALLEQIMHGDVNTTVNLGSPAGNVPSLAKLMNVLQTLGVVGVAGNSVANIIAAPLGTEGAGTLYIVSSAPTGTFAGQANAIAYLQTSLTWAFFAPVAGQKLYVQAAGQRFTYLNGAWAQDGVPSAVQQTAADVAAATTAALPAYAYANGAAGVGATITITANGAAPATDGVAAVLNQRIWVQNEKAGNAP
jgi:hypothetical protein